MATESKRDSFIIYRSFMEIIRELDDMQAKEFIMAISDYALDGVEPTLEGTLSMLWKPVKPQLDANRKRYENGKKGGAPKGSRNNPNGRRGKNREVAEQTEIKSHLTKPECGVMASLQSERPTLDQVRDYINSSKANVDAEKFFFHYDSLGWMSGSTPITNWKSRVLAWDRKERERSHPECNNPGTLGEGEYYNAIGNRTYGSGEITVPSDALPRPGADYWWSESSNQWENHV